MNTVTLRMRRSINVMLVLSMVASFFILPVTPVKAGVLSTVWSAIRPLLTIAGRVGGAVAGATLCSAFVPPLGMLAGAIGGWIVGGMITDYASGSLSNLAATAGGVAGAIAMGPGIFGMAGGFLLGGILGKIAYSLIKKVDTKLTGGLIFNRGASGNGAALAPTTVSTGVTTTVTSSQAQTSAVTADKAIQAAQAKYQAAYQAYVSATQGGDAMNITNAHQNYLKAYSEYQVITGTTPK
ncbi:MAG: hypothetical protein WA705_07835 [Candidatus Ozemobacteraceae bacterium]